MIQTLFYVEFLYVETILYCAYGHSDLLIVLNHTSCNCMHVSVHVQEIFFLRVVMN